MDESIARPARPSHHRNVIPAIAVLAVATAALAAAWFTLRPDAEDRLGRPDRPLDVPVVRAPPLESQTTALGAAPACRNCGTVEAVVPQDKNTHFQLRVRMDDGTTKTLEQSIPALAGARVVVQGGVARPATANGSQG